MVQFLTGILKMFAEVIFDGKPSFLHFRLEDVRHQRHAATAAHTSLRAFFDAGNIG